MEYRSTNNLAGIVHFHLPAVRLDYWYLLATKVTHITDVWVIVGVCTEVRNAKAYASSHFS